MEPERRIAGRYEIVREDGEGPAMHAFRALDHEVEVEVALWLVRPELLPDDPDRRVFCADAVRARAIGHPSLRKLFDAGVHAGTCYVTLQPLDGRTLAAVLRDRTPWDDAEIARAGIALAEALAAGHAANLVHGRVSPGEIMMVAGGAPKLGGMGLWRALDATAAGEAFAQAARFLAPEVRAHQPPTAAADVYSLAAVLAALAIGDAPDLGERLAALRPKLALVLGAALGDDPTSRPKAAELAVALAALIAPAPAPRAPTPPPASRATPAPSSRDTVDGPDTHPDEDPGPTPEVRSVPVRAATPSPAVVPPAAAAGAGAEEEEAPTRHYLSIADAPAADPDFETDEVAPPPIAPDLAAPRPGLDSAARSIAKPSTRPGTPAAMAMPVTKPITKAAAAPRAALIVDDLPEVLGEDEVSHEVQLLTPPPVLPLTADPSRELTPPPLAPAPTRPGSRGRPETAQVARPASPAARARRPNNLPLYVTIGVVLVAVVAGMTWLIIVLVREPKHPTPAVAAHTVVTHADAGAPAPVVTADPLQPCPKGTQLVSGAPSFCIDTYEAPGEGFRPVTSVTLDQARDACRAHQKHLCTGVEWERACRGTGGKSWPYGDSFMATKCNTRGGAHAALASTGAFKECVSGAGAYDMSGNAAEWVDEGATRGGSVADGDDGRCSRVAPRRDGFTSADVGYRCCATPGAF